MWHNLNVLNICAPLTQCNYSCHALSTYDCIVVTTVILWSIMSWHFSPQYLLACCFLSHYIIIKHSMFILINARAGALTNACFVFVSYIIKTFICYDGNFVSGLYHSWYSPWQLQMILMHQQSWKGIVRLESATQLKLKLLTAARQACMFVLCMWQRERERKIWGENHLIPNNDWEVVVVVFEVSSVQPSHINQSVLVGCWDCEG